jgi:hypothetical protein
MGTTFQMGPRGRVTRIKALFTAVAGCAAAATTICQATPPVPYMGPTVGPGVSYGIPLGSSPEIHSIGGGTFLGSFGTFSASTGISAGTRDLLWDVNGSVIPLQTLGTSTTGHTNEWVGTITSTEQLIGWAEKYSSAGTTSARARSTGMPPARSSPNCRLLFRFPADTPRPLLPGATRRVSWWARQTNSMVPHRSAAVRFAGRPMERQPSSATSASTDPATPPGTPPGSTTQA